MPLQEPVRWAVFQFQRVKLLKENVYSFRVGLFFLIHFDARLPGSPAHTRPCSCPRALNHPLLSCWDRPACPSDPSSLLNVYRDGPLRAG